MSVGLFGERLEIKWAKLKCRVSRTKIKDLKHNSSYPVSWVLTPETNQQIIYKLMRVYTNIHPRFK